jgi:hypothetical protein
MRGPPAPGNRLTWHCRPELLFTCTVRVASRYVIAEAYIPCVGSWEQVDYIYLSAYMSIYVSQTHGDAKCSIVPDARTKYSTA